MSADEGMAPPVLDFTPDEVTVFDWQESTLTFTVEHDCSACGGDGGWTEEYAAHSRALEPSHRFHSCGSCENGRVTEDIDVSEYAMFVGTTGGWFIVDGHLYIGVDVAAHYFGGAKTAEQVFGWLDHKLDEEVSDVRSA